MSATNNFFFAEADEDDTDVDITLSSEPPSADERGEGPIGMRLRKDSQIADSIQSLYKL